MDNDQLIVSCTECGVSFTLEEIRKGFVVFYDRYGQSLDGFPDETPSDSEASDMTEKIIKSMAICDGCETDD